MGRDWGAEEEEKGMVEARREVVGNWGGERERDILLQSRPINCEVYPRAVG